MASGKPLVLVLGATGFTGRSIIQGLLKSGNFRIAALIRPGSVSKPATDALRACGVEIRVGDINDGVESLKKLMEGVDVLISAVVASLIMQQKDVIVAAKEVGIQRVVPCDFATPGVKGVRGLHDLKLAIREFIQELGVGYTFIDVGWWMQTYLPLPMRSNVPEQVKLATYSVYGSGESKALVTDLNHIGTYVARVVGDPRTLNRAVVVWEDEVSQNAAHEVGERISGDGEALKAKRIPISAENLLTMADEGRAEVAKDPKSLPGNMKMAMSEYMYSMHILEENTLHNAKRLGYLDARELYPDIPEHTLEEFAREWYNLEEPGFVFTREIRLD